MADRLLHNQNAETLREAAAPKVTGTVNLLNVTAFSGPRGVALFSSIAALLGNSAQANYAAANKAMDAFAMSQSSKVMYNFLVVFDPQ